MSKFENKVVNRMIKNHTDSMNLAIPDKYSHIDFTPPKGAIEAAKRAITLADKEKMKSTIETLNKRIADWEILLKK